MSHTKSQSCGLCSVITNKMTHDTKTKQSPQNTGIKQQRNPGKHGHGINRQTADSTAPDNILLQSKIDR